MKRCVALAVVALLCPALLAGSPDDPKKGNEAFERLKSLVGTWKGKSSEGEIMLTYKLVSGGSTVMEINDSEKHKDGMITMYHLDGNALMMTHYCSMGNQPRMKASALTGDGKLAFTFVGATNMSKNDAHMHALTITFKDANSMSQNWTMRSAGNDEMRAQFEMTRAVN